MMVNGKYFGGEGTKEDAAVLKGCKGLERVLDRVPLRVARSPRLRQEEGLSVMKRVDPLLHDLCTCRSCRPVLACSAKSR